MASGSSNNLNSASTSKAFDFSADDVICSIDDYGVHENSNGKRIDSTADSRERVGRSMANAYNKQEESSNHEVTAIVERTMKKYADNIIRFLEGVSGRLAQLELYCYNLEQLIGDLRSDITRDNGEADLKLRSLEKHLKEVHRSVQILRDKQELSDTQKELEKLQLVKEAAAKSHSQQKDDGLASSTSDSQKHDNTPEVQNQHLALALSVPTSLPTRPAEPQLQPGLTSLPLQQMVHSQQPVLASLPQQTVHTQQLTLPSLPPPQTIQVQTQPNIYYTQQTQLPNQPPQTQQHPQDPRVQVEFQYGPQRPQLQDMPRQAPQPQPPASQSPSHPFPPYQQQWTQPSPQQFPQEAQLPPQAPSSHVRPQMPPGYPPYPHQPPNPPPESFPRSMSMQAPSSGGPQSSANRPDSAVYGYGGPSRTVQPPPSQHNLQRQPLPQTNQSSYPPIGDSGYPSTGPQPPQSSMHGYLMYDADGRTPYPPHYPQGSYAPRQISALQNQQAPPGGRLPNLQVSRNHPYYEMIEKAMSMGYPRERVASVIHRMEESGQPIDVDGLLDRLNMRY